MNETINGILIAHSRKLSRDLEDAEHKLSVARDAVRQHEEHIVYLKGKIAAIAEQVEVPPPVKSLQDCLALADAKVWPRNGFSRPT